MKILILETAFSTSGIHRKISNIVKSLILQMKKIEAYFILFPSQIF